MGNTENNSNNQKVFKKSTEFHRNRCKTESENMPRVHQHRRDYRRKAEMVDHRSTHFRNQELNSQSVRAVFENYSTKCQTKVKEPSERKVSVSMVRTSSPSPDICFHCAHDHKEMCCLYLHDELQDGPRYSDFKRRLETDDYFVDINDGVVAGNISFCSAKDYPGRALFGLLKTLVIY
jgi:hypothetical protein